jgi:hypothetical protein
MIIVVMPSDEPEDRAADVCERFAAVVHSKTPDGHVLDLASGTPRRRAVCGDLACGGLTGRVIPTEQGLCPHCGGSVTSADEVDRIRALFSRGRDLGLYSEAEADVRRLRSRASHHIPVG